MPTQQVPRPRGKSLMAEFRDLLQKRMEERKMSIAQLAREAEVGRPYLHRVLAGDQIPTVDWMEKVGKKVGIFVKLTVR